LKLLIFIKAYAVIGFAHCIGCGWVLIGYLEGFGSTPWVPDKHFSTQDPISQYLTAFFWVELRFHPSVLNHFICIFLSFDNGVLILILFSSLLVDYIDDWTRF
jgi:hypothetical protein